MRSLTVEEARLRAESLRVDRYTIDLDLDRGPDLFASRAEITFAAASAVDTFVDVKPTQLTSAYLDGAEVAVADLEDGRLPLRLDAGQHVLIVQADMPLRNDGEGIHRAVDPADGNTYLYGMSFLDAAPSVFACFDQPDLKARFRISVTAPTGWTVLGNTRATQVSPGRWELSESVPLSTYHLTVVAGPYHSVTREHDGILLGIHAAQSLAEHLDKDADEIFDVTARAFDEYHRLFGIRYPFGDYHQAFVPEFNAGAMENPGCVTFRDSMVFRSQVPDSERSDRARVIVHEMAHMWFGDLVTMRWWDDLWLNESFAEYMAYRLTGAVSPFQDSWVDFAYFRKRWGLVADQRPSTHPVAGNGAPDAETALSDFDGISYAKGAAALKQLKAFLGDDIFLEGVRRHLRAHSYGNATLDDLFGAWQDAGAKDLDRWVEGWLRTPGADTLRVQGGRLTRTAPAEYPAHRPHGLTVRHLPTGTEHQDQHIEMAGDSARLTWQPTAGTLIIPDAGDDTWAKVRYDEYTLAALPGRIGSIADPVTRGAIWLAVRDATADAELSCEFVLTLLEAALPVETEDIAIQSLSGWADNLLLSQYLGGDRQSRDRVAAVVEKRLATASPGSGLQLAAALGFATVQSGSSILPGWLAGEAPPGLVMDAEMRWATLTSLARSGAASLDDIEAELRRDTSAQGVIHAARCRASLPESEAKQAAWQGIMTNAGLSNYEVFALCEGFWRAEHSDLLEPYVERYFDEIATTSAIRTGWLVAETGRLAFPAYAATEATVDRAERLLADASLPSGLRRSVADATDDLRRAIRVRAAEPASRLIS